MNELERSGEERHGGSRSGELEPTNAGRACLRRVDLERLPRRQPPLYLNTVWDNLLITRDWTIWITDHTGAFRTRKRLESPESLKRCDRALLRRLRELNREQLQRTLGKYLSSEQLDALEVRRDLLVKHFDEQIASKGEAAVLYDLPVRE